GGLPGRAGGLPGRAGGLPGGAGGIAASEPSFLPGPYLSFRSPLPGWGTVRVQQRPKLAVAELRSFLGSFKPLELSPWRN
ncbi:MAG: hypothetical protein WCQ50_19045, partial [Spirochaetota bacterium]